MYLRDCVVLMVTKKKSQSEKKITDDPGKNISLKDFQATFNFIKDVPIASSSLSETVIVSSELSYTPIH